MKCNDLITDEVRITEEFNNYFTSSGESLASKICSNYIFNETAEPAVLKDFIPLTEEGVSTIISNLSNTKSTGYDKLSMKILKQFKSTLFVPLTDILNKSLCSGIFPVILKITKTIPIFKSDA